MHKRAKPCPICGQMFFPSSLPFHMKECEKKAARQTIPCHYCDQEFTRSEMDAHLKRCPKRPRQQARPRPAQTQRRPSPQRRPPSAGSTQRSAGSTRPTAGNSMSIQGLKSRPELNGSPCTVVERDMETGRYLVALSDGTRMKVKHECLSSSSAGSTRPTAGNSMSIQGLKSRPELNGSPCTVVERDMETGRYLVALPDGTRMKIKPECLSSAPAAASSSRQRQPSGRHTGWQPQSSGYAPARSSPASVMPASACVRPCCLSVCLTHLILDFSPCVSYMGGGSRERVSHGESETVRERAGVRARRCDSETV